MSERHRPSLRAIKEALDAGKLGEPGLLRVHRWEPTAPLWPRIAELVDVAWWLFDRRPLEVFALGRGPAEDGDYVQLHLGFGEGGMALLDVARSLPPGDSYSSFSLIGSGGAAYADDHRDRQLLFVGGPARALLGSAGTERRGPVVDLVGADVVAAARASLASGRAVRWTGEGYT